MLADLEAGLVAFTNVGTIWIYGPPYLERPSAARRGIVIHEYFHTMQRELSRSMSQVAPFWLREGSARLVEYRIAGREGLLDYAVARASEVRRSYSFGSLQDLETRSDASSSGGYTLGFLASEYLENLVGPDALRQGFWKSLSGGANWRQAFAATFGVSLEQFYADFEAYRLRDR